MISDEDKQKAENRLLSIRKSIKQAVQKCIRKLEKQQEELEESQKSLWYQQIGDSLLACTQQVSRGTARLTITNVHTQTEESIAINPKMNLKENAQLFFKKAKKGKRGMDVSNRKVESTNDELAILKKLEAEIDTHSNQSAVNVDSALDDFEQRLSECVSQPARPSSNDNPIHAKEKPATPYRYFSLEGWDIYIGRSDTQNDELTTRFAAPSDIWLHVAGHAGSHVVIKRPKGAQFPPHSVLEIAAAFSIWFSKAKHTSFAEVHMTEVRFVRKRRHAPAGEVIAERCKSIRVAPRSPQDIFPSEKYKEDSET